MQHSLSNLPNLLVKVLFVTKLSIYTLESQKCNVTVYTQLYKLQIKSHFQTPLGVQNKFLTFLCYNPVRIGI